MTDLKRLLDDLRPLELLRRDKEEGALSHAYALFGDDPVAMEWILRRMAEIIVCKKGGCGECPACLALNGGVHPDVRFYEGALTVKDVEELIEDSVKFSVEGGVKIYAVFALDKTGAPAQNKLLKTVEEPPEGVIFLFGVTKPSAVAETLKSRCKKLNYNGVEQGRLQEALRAEYGDSPAVRSAAAYAGGSISRALALAADESFAVEADNVVALLGAMKKSSDVPGETARAAQDKEHVKRRLDVMEIVLDMVGKYKRGLTDGGGGIAGIAEDFNYAALADAEYLVNDCRKRLESNCAPSAVSDTLLFGILEVKYKCRR